MRSKLVPAAKKNYFSRFFDTTNENIFYIWRSKWNVHEGELRIIKSYVQAGESVVEKALHCREENTTLQL